MNKVLKGDIPIAFGGAAISGEGGGYGFGEISNDQANSLLKHSFEMGIKIFDTAPCYGYHLSERRIGQAFKSNREEVIIVSKCGVTWHPNRRLNLTNNPVVAKKMLEDSLRELNSDYIDLYMIHWPDRNIDIRRPMEVLAKAKGDGKIKHIGLCNTNKNDIIKAMEIDLVEVVQSEFNIFNRTVEEELFPTLKEYNIEFMSYGTFDKGMLTGKITKNRVFDKSDLRSWAPWWKKSGLEEKIKKVETIKTFAKEHHHTLVELALGHNLNHQQVTVGICGARDKNQVDSIIRDLSHLPTKKNIDTLLELIDG